MKTIIATALTTLLLDACRILVYAFLVQLLWRWGWVDLSWLKEVLSC